MPLLEEAAHVLLSPVLPATPGLALRSLVLRRRAVGAVAAAAAPRAAPPALGDVIHVEPRRRHAGVQLDQLAFPAQHLHPAALRVVSSAPCSPPSCQQLTAHTHMGPLVSKFVALVVCAQSLCVAGPHDLAQAGPPAPAFAHARSRSVPGPAPRCPRRPRERATDSGAVVFCRVRRAPRRRLEACGGRGRPPSTRAGSSRCQTRRAAGCGP